MNKPIDLFPTGGLYVVSGPAMSHKSHFAEYVARSYRQKGLRDALVLADAPFTDRSVEAFCATARRACASGEHLRVLVVDDAHLLVEPPGDYRTPLEASCARLKVLHRLAEELSVDLYAVCMQDKSGRTFDGGMQHLITTAYELQTMASGEPGVVVFDPNSDDEVEIYKFVLREDGLIDGVVPYVPATRTH